MRGGWRVGNGRSISVWDDAWLPGPQPCKINIDRVSGIVRVLDLIDMDKSEWQSELIRTLFSEPLRRSILRLSLAGHDLSDRWRWFLKDNGEYLVQSGYKLLLRGSLRTDDDCYINIAQHTRLLYKHLWTVDDTPINWVGQLFAQGTCHVKLFILTIWTTLLIFVLGYLRELDFLQSNKGGVRVNFDAGFFVNLQVASAGVIVRDSAGLILGLTCFWQDNVSCLLTSEAFAYVRAICFAQDLGFQKVELEGDSTVLISKLNAIAIDRSTISSIIWDAKRLVLGFEHFKFHHIKRRDNTTAHLLAREGSLLRRDQHRFRRRWIVIGGGRFDFADTITDVTILARSDTFLAIFVSTSTLYVDRWLTLGVLEFFRACISGHDELFSGV
ncbi:hypothetical protein CXB51_000750 [Gossypium anomalum]|uniref:RNase H type-1 domain-containing protein n=1 Tax=Gossypium anomalum TaxID=47600 RepID=A0A8J5ZJE4_9ROSI|nr:hypothetical protein CXB51_000750 [Gossypium anomalum]